MRQHALLAASTSSRWLVCTPSAVLESKQAESSSDYADEGTLAHTLAELQLKHKLKRITAPEYARALEDVYQNKHFNESMQDYVDDYVAFVLESLEESGNGAQIFLETKLELDDYVPEGFGHVDVNIVNDGILDVIDLKYGKGVFVDAENNKQMMLYALGALREFELSYSIEEVRMTIYQPRIDNYSSFSMKVTDLLHWAETELKPKAKLAFEGLGELVPGEHCRFCKLKTKCKANADYHLELAKYEFAPANELTPAEVSDVLKRADLFINWINAVYDYALDEALKKGTKWPGFKIVSGRSNRVYSSELEVITKLKKEGFKDELIFIKKLAGITEMQKRIGKTTFDKMLTPLLIKPTGSPTLVPEDDKRPEYKSAKDDFAE